MSGKHAWPETLGRAGLEDLDAPAESLFGRMA